jgi:hypothetical protein
VWPKPVVIFVWVVILTFIVIVKRLGLDIMTAIGAVIAAAAAAAEVIRRLATLPPRHPRRITP